MHAVSIKTVYGRLREWLLDQGNVGDYVTDVSLDLLNRANQNLWGKQFWQDLMKWQLLTLTNKVATLPSDFGKTYCVFEDSDSDGKPDKYYYLNGKPINGYRKETVYTKADGKSFTFRFFQTPGSPLYLLHQKVIDDFTAAGVAEATEAAREYIFWPEELLLLEAQLIHKQDADDTGDGNYDRIKAAHKDIYTAFKRSAQFDNPDYVLEQNDAAGTRVSNQSSDLLGGDSFGGFHHDNSMDG